jgi:ATP-binding cassette subfamily B multidrug efflux pump
MITMMHTAASRIFRHFEDMAEPFGPFEARTPPRRYSDYMFTQLAPFKRWLPWMALISLAVALAEIALIFYAGRFVDLMTETGAEAFLATHWLELAVVFVLILIARPVLFTLQHLLLDQTMVSNMQDQVRWRAHRHLLGQPMAFFQNDFAGRLSNRVMQQGGAVEDTAFMMFEAVWFAAVYAVSAVVFVAGFNIWLMVPLTLWLVAYVIYTLMLARRVAVASEKSSDARSLVTGRIVDAYANMETVKLFAADGQEESFVLSALKRHRLRFQRFLRLMTELHFVLTVMNGVLIVAVMGLATGLWMNGLVTIGEVAACAALVIRLNGISGWIIWVIIRIFEHMGTINEGLRSIAVPQTVTDVPGAPALQVKHGEIRFEGVTQLYGRDKGGLDALDLVIKPGERVGLVGRSGAGKTTLINLLLRFRDTEEGRVTIDGQDVSAVKQTTLRQSIGVVTQDSSLLHRSIRANLLYGKPDATDAEMIEAAKRAQADAFIDELVDPQGRIGYDAHVGERGVKLSGGQRQRVAIARVMLKDAPILVLDEATSALDSEVEAAIQETLYGMMQGKTVIAIAHRLSTIAQLDRIVVLDAGKVVEDGSHTELLQKNGLYASFWNRQSGGFLATEAGEAAE